MTNIKPKVCSLFAEISEIYTKSEQVGFEFV